MYSAIQNNPIQIDLVTEANVTGWTTNADGSAQHLVCNSGFLILKNYPVIVGHTYKVSYIVVNIDTGIVRVEIGGASGVSQSSPGTYTESIIAETTTSVQFFSNANCTISNFVIKDVTIQDAVTIVYSTENKKWSDFRDIYPDYVWSIYTKLILAKDGAIYASENGSSDRNNFFGTQYASRVQIVDSKDPSAIKNWLSINYQCNTLLVTTVDGITTSLGQVSELADSDFVKDYLNQSGASINVYSIEGVYSASFLRDKNVDLLTGDQLKGNFLIIELVMAVPSDVLKLYTIDINSNISKIGVR